MPREAPETITTRPNASSTGKLLGQSVGCDVTAGEMPRGGGSQNLWRLASFAAQRAARCKAAPIRHVVEGRHAARNGGERLVRAIHPRNRREQRTRVGVGGLCENLLHGRFFDNL